MYSISGYGRMIAPSARMDAYMRALRQTIKPGAVVVDIGTGLGVFAILACQLGARRVYAIEPQDVIQVAREIAMANRCVDRIEFIQALSTEITLPERADVIVSDLRGVLPFFRHHLPSIVDARRRFLAPGGVLIPQRDILRMAVVEAPDLYYCHVAPWHDQSYGIDLTAASRMVSNTWWKARVKPDQLLGASQWVATLDYTSVDRPDLRVDLTWTATRAGTAHGLSIWFDALVMPDIGFSNAPGAPEIIYGSAFFPWTAPVTLAPGDSVRVGLYADLVGEDYIWRWESRVFDGHHPEQIKADFQQSTFFGAPLSLARLHKRAGSYIPVLSEDGLIDQFVLALMDGQMSLGAIAQRVAEKFPGQCGDEQHTLSRVGELAQKYSR